ncbi:MAG: hypothetical protein GEV04_19825 [Actinophytocola sp.]|nr:hypothetical protein [Actinophytocola sp.]
MSNELTDTQVAKALESLPEWTRHGDALVRDIAVEDDTRDLLVQDVKAVADGLGHQPVLETTPDGIRLLLSSRPAAGITTRDVELAAALDQVLSGTTRHEGPQP